MKEFSARDYLKIDVASNFGLDKQSWEDRISWFNQNEHHLEKFITTADKPALFYAGIQAWKDVQEGKPSGYPISLDACSSGLQIMACLVSDVSTAKLCGVVSTGNREDLYTNVYDYMNNLIGEVGKIERSDVKQAVMTAAYGSEAMPKIVFGEGNLLQAFYTAMETLTPHVWELNKMFLAIWNPEALEQNWILPDNFHVNIKIMGSVKESVHFMNKPCVIIQKKNIPKKVGRSIGANVTHSLDGMIVREMARRCSYDKNQIDAVKAALINYGKDAAIPCADLTVDEDTKMVLTLWKLYKDSGYLSARILDHLNDSNVCYVNQEQIAELLLSLPDKPFELLSIHDCWRCLPSYGNDLRRQYALQLSLIAKSNLLSFIVSQITGKEIQIGKDDENMWKAAAVSDYALS